MISDFKGLIQISLIMFGNNIGNDFIDFFYKKKKNKSRYWTKDLDPSFN